MMLPTTPTRHGVIVIQLVLTALAVWALTRTFLRFRKRSISATEWVIWSGFWLAIVVCVMKPEITQWFADILGVGRGADAMFYLGFMGLSYGFFRLYLRSRQSEQHLTQLVRRLAIERCKAEQAALQHGPAAADPKN
jgi:hypothetical protein